MIVIITGPVNSGKTTKMAAIYRETGMGDGFILPKVFIGGRYAGQNIMQLSTGIAKPFSLAEKRFSRDREAFQYRNYSFCTEGQQFAENIVQKAISAHASPVFLDEVGPVELKRQGFYKLLQNLLENNADLFLSVRGECLKDIVKCFHIKQYRLVFPTLLAIDRNSSLEYERSVLGLYGLNSGDAPR